MEFTLQSFLRFLRNFVSIFRNRLGHLANRLWHIFAIFRSRSPPSHPKKTDDTRRRIRSRSAKPSSTAVICASRLPPPLTPIIGGDSPDLSSLSPVSIQVRRPTNNPEDIPEEYDGNNADRLDADGYFPEAMSGSPGYTTGYHDDPDPIHHDLFINREDSPSTPPVIPTRPDSRPSSGYSRSQTSQYGAYRTGYWQESQRSLRAPSVPSFRSQRSLSGAESAARGYIPEHQPPRPPSPTRSHYAPSLAGSVASRVYSAPRPTTRVRRRSPMTNAPRRGDRSRTPVSVHQGVQEIRIDVPVPELPQPEPRTTESVSRDRNSAVVSVGPLRDQPPEGKLRPMIGIDRYEKQKAVVIEDVKKEQVCLPVTTEFERSVPENWTPLMHPEGALYWFNKEELIYTDTDMCNPVLRQRIEEALEEIDELKKSCPPLPDDCELALELGEDGKTGELICSYYYVRISTRCLFWLHQFDPECAMENLRGVTERTHIHVALQSQYWLHWEMYPHDRDVPKELIQELLGILVHAGVDCMTSSNSTAAYSEGELSKLLAYVRNIESIGGNYGFSACVVGRLMSFVTHSRYLNFYGQKGARLGNDQTIYGHQPKRTYLIRTLSIFFFYAPELHLTGLESVYTDSVICQHRWAQFIRLLQDDWKEFILYGTVLLNANVAFLAIPSVDPGNRTRTPSQLASYLSIITSVGSIVIGLLLLRQHRTKPQDSADEVDNYLRSRHNNELGFETLAILYSLPYSLLLWSTMAFTVAFTLETLLFSRQTWSKLSVGIALAMMILLISWCIWATVEFGTDFSSLSGVHHLKTKLVRFTKGLRGKDSESVPGAGDGADGSMQGNRGKSGSWKGAFDFARRRRGFSMSSTLVANGTSRPSDSMEMEMGKMNTKDPGTVLQV